MNINHNMESQKPTNKLLNLSDKFKKAIVTGGAGFIGSHLVESLLLDGLEVISIDDYSAGKKENITPFKKNPRFLEVKADITNKEEIANYFDDVDIIFHQAVSKMTVCLRNPSRDLEVNAQGTLNLLELAKDYKVRKFIYASTGSVYGDAQYYPTDEKHPVNPNSFYGVSKLGAEKYARVFHHLYGIDTVILRYFHVYGPRQDNSDLGGVVPIFARRAINNQPLIIYGDGSQIRSFTYVKDVVNINKLVALTDGISGEAYNCASGVEVTIKELADAVLNYFDKNDLPIEYQDWKAGDIKFFNVSNEKIKKLGFNFEVPFEIGFKQTMNSVYQHIKELG
jgi:UDP-glucose 4-epimerase